MGFSLTDDVTLGDLIINKTTTKHDLKKKYRINENDIDSIFSTKLNLSKISDKINNILRISNYHNKMKRSKRSAESRREDSILSDFLRIMYLDQSDSEKIDQISDLLKV